MWEMQSKKVAYPFFITLIEKITLTPISVLYYNYKDKVSQSEGRCLDEKRL